MLIPIFGELISSAGLILNVYYKDLPMEVAGLTEALFEGITGGWATMLMGAFSYVADVTTEETRTVRIGIANTAFSIGLPIAMAAGGFLLRWVVKFQFFYFFKFFFLQQRHRLLRSLHNFRRNSHNRLLLRIILARRTTNRSILPKIPQTFHRRLFRSDKCNRNLQNWLQTRSEVENCVIYGCGVGGCWADAWRAKCDVFVHKKNVQLEWGGLWYLSDVCDGCDYVWWVRKLWNLINLMKILKKTKFA